MNIGLYIGRFQPFHNGHRKIVDTMLRENEHIVILIWLSHWISNNPYSYSDRLHFFTHTYPNEDSLEIYPLQDEDTDRDWIQSILAFPKIVNANEIYLYCWDKAHDSAVRVIEKFQSYFLAQIHIREVSRNLLPLTATDIRKNITQWFLEDEKNNIPPDVYEYIKYL